MGGFSNLITMFLYICVCVCILDTVKKNLDEIFLSMYLSVTTCLHRVSERAKFHACMNVNLHKRQLRITEEITAMKALAFMILSKLIKVLGLLNATNVILS